MDIRGEHWSPNGFPVGQCTWYVDGRVKQYFSGWKLNFSSSSGRDAYKWWTMVTNMHQGNARFTGSYKGEVMVLNQWTGNPYGHVAFVESSSADSNGGKYWTVTHANFKTGSPVKYMNVEGSVRYTSASGYYPIYKGTFYRVSGSYSQVSLGGTAKYPLRGFLYK
jgi:hypothetical protein